MFDLPGFTAGVQPGTVEFDDGTDAGSAVLPFFTSIVREHISGWDGEFLRLREAFRAPCPANRLRVQTGLGNIFRYVLDQRPRGFAGVSRISARCSKSLRKHPRAYQTEFRQR